MLRLRKPSDETMRRFLDEQSELGFSYRFVGATSTTPPTGFVVDHTRVRLGAGETVFRAGTAALREWRQFQLGWVSAWPAATPIRTGEVVAVRARIAGVWWLNACRIVAVFDSEGIIGDDVIRRFGFCYGTLPGHAEKGEERFLIEWNRTDDSVWFDILAFSRPNHPLTRLAYPWVRLIQKRFAREAAATMRATVAPDAVHKIEGSTGTTG